MFKDILTSSADPKKLSLTVKAVLVAIVPFVISYSGLAEADVNSFIEILVDVIYLGGSLISAIFALWGVARKIYLGRWSAPKE